MNSKPSYVTGRTRTSTKVALVSAITIAAALLQAPAAHATPDPTPIVSDAWTYIITDSGATITGYDETLGHRNNLVIPESIDSHLVTAIGGNAFLGDDLTGNVTMPDTITSIGLHAFEENDFDTIHLSTSLTTIGTYGFASNYSLESIVLPPSLDNIGDFAFDGNVSLNLIASLASTPPAVGSDTFAGVEPGEIQVSTGVVAAWATFDGLDVVGVECVNASGGYFAGGSGTTSDPYTIATAAQLDSIRSIYRGCDFELMTDISLQPYIDEHPGGPGGITSWYPIGSVTEPFTGNFNGSNNSITNLEVTGTNNRVGLFGVTLRATIHDLRLSGAVEGAFFVGGLIGKAETTMVTHVDVAVVITASRDFVGGLIGEASDVSIEKSSASGNIAMAVDRVYGGGLVGSYVSSAPGNHISQSYATGNVMGSRDAITREGSNYVGGLIGDVSTMSRSDAPSISDVYATGNVRGAWQVGGLIGRSSVATVTRAFATGDVDGQSPLLGTAWGGLIGQASSGDTTVTASFWDIATTGYDASAPYEWTYLWQERDGAGGGLATADMKKITSYLLFGWNITGSGWSEGAVWGICAAANNGYPFLKDSYTSSSYPCSDPAPSSPATPDETTSTLTEVTQTLAPTLAITPIATSPILTATPAVGTTPQFPKISASAPATFKTALAQLSRSVPASSTVKYSIPLMYQKNCTIRQDKIVALKAGTCGIRITSTSLKGKQTNQRVYLTVT